MKLNRAELRKIMYDFNSISNRLLQADYNDHTGVVGKFVAFIKATPIIYDYIFDCGSCDWNMDEEFQEIRQSYGRPIFSLGDTNEDEFAMCLLSSIMWQKRVWTSPMQLLQDTYRRISIKIGSKRSMTG